MISAPWLRAWLRNDEAASAGIRHALSARGAPASNLSSISHRSQTRAPRALNRGREHNDQREILGLLGERRG